MVAEARPIEDHEFDDSIYVSPAEIEEAMGVTVEEVVRPLKQRKTDRIILYHPDPENTSSIYIVPMNTEERRWTIGRLLQKTKLVNGQRVRWNFPRPQVEPKELPLRCFIYGCERRGGFSTRAQLIAHVTGKHANEAPMYQRLIDALMEQVYKDIPPEQYEMYGLTPPDEAPKGKKAAPA